MNSHRQARERPRMKKPRALIEERGALPLGELATTTFRTVTKISRPLGTPAHVPRRRPEKCSRVPLRVPLKSKNPIPSLEIGF